MKRIKLKEAIEDFQINSTVQEEPGLQDQGINTTFKDDLIPEEQEDSLFKDESIPEQVKFIDSDELNELRDIIYNLSGDIHLLLINNDCIIIVKEDEDNKSWVYCLAEDDSEFTFVELSNKLEEILSNNNIIKYMPDQTYDNHQKVVELLSRDLPPELQPEKEVEEVNEEIQDEDSSDEEVDLDEEKIKA